MRPETVASLSQERNLNSGMSVRICIFAASLLPVVLSFAAPLRQSTGGFPNGEFIYRLLSLICHQLPSRSFWILGFPCGLCSRCLLGYFGIALAALFVSRPQKYSRRALLGIVLLLPVILDISIWNAIGYQSGNPARAVTGLTGGIGVFILCFPLRFEKSLISKEVL